MSKPLTPKPSSLFERLQADQAQLQHQFAEQTKALLQQHGETLNKLSSDARRSTRSVMRQHQDELDALHRQMLARTRWLLLWPIGTTLLTTIALVICAALWVNHRLQQIDDAQAALDQATAAAPQREPQGLKSQPSITPRKRR